MKLQTSLQISQILRPMAFILTSVLMSKTSLSTAEIGNFESLFFIGTTVSYFWITGLMQATLAYTPLLPEAEKPAILRSIALIFIGLGIFIFFIFSLSPKTSIQFLTGQTSIPYFSLFSLYLLFTLPAFFLESLWTVENRPLSILIFSLVSNMGFVLAVVCPLFLNKEFIISFYALIALGIIRFIWLIIILIKNKKQENKTITNQNSRITNHYSQFTKIALPLMGYALLNGFVMAFISWIVVWYYLGDTEIFAVFRFGAREFPLVVAMTTGLSNAFVPKLAKNLNLPISQSHNLIISQSLSELKIQTLKLWHILFPITIVLMLLSKLLFPIVFNPSFSESADIFCIFLLLLISRALFPQTILLALKETKIMLWISILETLIIVLLSFTGIYTLGTEGVAWALVVGFLIEKIIIILFLKRRYSIHFKDYTSVKWYFIYSTLLIAAYLIQNIFQLF